MRPYSVDFRQKIIDVWEKEKISIRELAKRFNVAKSYLLYEKTEIKVSRATLGRITKKLNQSFPKKFHRSPRKLAKK